MDVFVRNFTNFSTPQSLSNDLIISQFKQQSAGNFKGDKKANNEANQNEASPVKRRSTSQMDVRINYFSKRFFINHQLSIE